MTCMKYFNLHTDNSTALKRPCFKCINDILQAVDSEGGAILALLDLSAAFDTIGHQKRLD